MLEFPEQRDQIRPRSRGLLKFQNALREARIGNRFQQIVRRGGVKRCNGVFFIGRYKDNTARRGGGGHLEPTQSRHADVKERELRPKAPQISQCSNSIIDDRDDFNAIPAALQSPGQILGELRLIVGNEDGVHPTLMG